MPNTFVYKNISLLTSATSDASTFLNNNFTAIANQYAGTWSSSTAYAVNQIVYYSGSSYICLTANTNSVPPNANWAVFASGGYSGFSGTSGYSGYSGPSGSNGTSGYSGYSSASGYSGYSGVIPSNFSGVSGTFSGPVVYTEDVVSYSSSVTLNPTSAHDFSLTLTGNITLSVSNGTSGTDGQQIVIRIKQDSAGSRILTWGGSNIGFGSVITATTLSTAANKTDYITLKWSNSSSLWHVVAFASGY